MQVRKRRTNLQSGCLLELMCRNSSIKPLHRSVKKWQKSDRLSLQTAMYFEQFSCSDRKHLQICKNYCTFVSPFDSIL